MGRCGSWVGAGYGKVRVMARCGLWVGAGYGKVWCVF